MVDKLIGAGMDVARLNFSHGTHDTHRQVYNTLRSRAEAWGRPLAILQDLQGPKIRLGVLLPGRPTVMTDGETVILSMDPKDDRPNAFPADYEQLTDDVRPGDPILLDDGNVVLDVLSVTPKEVTCRVVQGGVLRSKVGMHLPHSRVSVPILSDKDLRDLKLGLELGVDYIALSFVRNAADVRRLRKEIGADEPHIIAKIETPEGLHNLDEILEVADGIMVARGDLGVELAPEKVPVAQKHMIDLANDARKPVIVATQMLETMIENMRPTRAEASDVANAVFDGADAVMLSGETANGAHPIRTVEMMSSIIREVEASPRYWHSRRSLSAGDQNYANAIARAAVAAQAELGLTLIAAHTMTGYSARLISSYRPKARVVALTQSKGAERRMNLYWGVLPLPVHDVTNTDELIQQVEEVLIKRGLAAPGQALVICSNIPAVSQHNTNFLKLHRIAS
jgi:pyruvate kinase